MSYIILVRNPRNGRVEVVDTGEGDNPPAAVFDTYEAAQAAAEMDVPVCRAWPYAVVEAP